MLILCILSHVASAHAQAHESISSCRSIVCGAITFLLRMLICKCSGRQLSFQCLTCSMGSWPSAAASWLCSTCSNPIRASCCRHIDHAAVDHASANSAIQSHRLQAKPGLVKLLLCADMDYNKLRHTEYLAANNNCVSCFMRAVDIGPSCTCSCKCCTSGTCSKGAALTRVVKKQPAGRPLYQSGGPPWVVPLQ
jgi:hypothetical protein